MDLSSLGLDTIFKVLEERLPLGKHFTTLISASVGLAAVVFALDYVTRVVVQPAVIWLFALMRAPSGLASVKILPTLSQAGAVAAVLVGLLALYLYLYRQVRTLRWKTDSQRREIELINASTDLDSQMRIEHYLGDLKDLVPKLENRIRVLEGASQVTR